MSSVAFASSHSWSEYGIPQVSRPCGRAPLALPCFVIREEEPWLDEDEDSEEEEEGEDTDEEEAGREIGATPQHRPRFYPLVPHHLDTFGLDNLGDMHTDRVAEDEGNSHDKKTTTRLSLGSKVLSALKYAADTATNSAFHQRRAHAALLPSDIGARPRMARPLLENPTYAWAAPEEEPYNALASKASSLMPLSSVRGVPFCGASANSNGSSCHSTCCGHSGASSEPQDSASGRNSESTTASSGSNHSAYDWTRGWA
mmetsp:Transcript_69688/g.134407  ORF Transcript_69688/g.134407 Transcript_69688/m.134407 type:complete len:257 (+) Transcript_69688:57-827(+)